MARRKSNPRRLAFERLERRHLLAAARIVYQQDFEAGDGGYTADNTGGTVPGLWHFSIGRREDTLPNHSPTHNWYYGIFETATGGGRFDYLPFDHQGTLTSPQIQLPACGTLQLDFNYLLDTRAQLDRDFAEVQVFDGQSITTVLSRAGGTLPATGRATWGDGTADLTPFAGKAISLIFTFRTGDPPLVDPEGWYVDDLVITQTPDDLCGYKWQDTNANAAWDAGEPGLNGWTIYVDKNNNGQLDTPAEPTAVTHNDGLHDGAFSFGTLEPGTYSICEVPRAGWSPTYPATANACHTVSVAAGQQTIGRFGLAEPPNFGNTETVTIRGAKFEDADADGLPREAQEAGLGGWTIYVDYNDNGTPDAEEPSATTQADGTYSIANIRPGAWKVREVLQAGWNNSFPQAGFYQLPVDPAASLDFGNWSPATIDGPGPDNSSVKFEDLDADGLPREPQEPGLGGWTIYVDYNDNGARDAEEPSGLTESGGQYTITGIRPGKWKVREVGQTGWTNSFPTTADSHGPFDERVFVSRGVATSVNFGNWRGATIQDSLKFEDLDADGQPREAGEGGLVGWTIFVDYNDNGAPDNGEPASATGADGAYSIADIQPGKWKVREVAQAGWTNSFPNTNDSRGRFDEREFVSGGVVTGVDFGNWSPAIIDGPGPDISSLKFEDLDGDGQPREPGEPGLGGWAIYVDYNDNGAPDAGEPTGTTGADGAYMIPGITPGTWKVREVPQTGWTNTFPATADTHGRFDQRTFVSHSTATSVNFGNARVRSADLSITKVDEPDPVHPGSDLKYTITLTNAGPDAALQVTVTDAVPANTTFLSATPPAGWVISKQPPVGGTGEIEFTADTLPAQAAVSFQIVVHVSATPPGGTIISNSATARSDAPLTPDPNPNNNSQTATTTVIQTVQFITPSSVYRLAGPGAPGSNDNPPAPPAGSASISGFLWHDVNQDGAWDAGESGRSGWLVFIDGNSNGEFDAGVERFAVTGSMAQVLSTANNGAGLIRVTTAAANTFASGGQVTISGVNGTTEANGTWTISVVDATHFDLLGSTFTHAYVSGGSAATVDDGGYSFTGLAAGTYTILENAAPPDLSEGTFRVETFPPADAASGGRHAHRVTLASGQQFAGVPSQAAAPNFGTFDYSPFVRPADDFAGHFQNSSSARQSELLAAWTGSGSATWQTFQVTNTTAAAFNITRIDRHIDTALIAPAPDFVTIWRTDGNTLSPLTLAPDGTLTTPIAVPNAAGNNTVTFFAFYDPVTRSADRSAVVAQFPDWYDDPATPFDEKTRPPHSFSAADHLTIGTDAALAFQVNLVGGSTYDSDIFADGTVDSVDAERLLNILAIRWPAVDGASGSVFEPTSDINTRFPNGANAAVVPSWPISGPPPREIGYGDFGPLNVEFAPVGDSRHRSRAPFLDMDADNSSGARGVDYVAKFSGMAVRVADVDARFANAGKLAGLTVKITNPQGGDQLLLDAAKLPPTIVRVPAADPTNELRLQGQASFDEYAKALRLIEYFNAAATPRTIEISVYATDGADFATPIGNVAVARIVDPPPAAAPASGFVAVQTGLSLADFLASQASAPPPALATEVDRQDALLAVEPPGPQALLADPVIANDWSASGESSNEPAWTTAPATSELPSPIAPLPQIAPLEVAAPHADSAPSGRLPDPAMPEHTQIAVVLSRIAPSEQPTTSSVPDPQPVIAAPGETSSAAALPASLLPAHFVAAKPQPPQEISAPTEQPDQVAKAVAIAVPIAVNSSPPALTVTTAADPLALFYAATSDPSSAIESPVVQQPLSVPANSGAQPILPAASDAPQSGPHVAHDAGRSATHSRSEAAVDAALTQLNAGEFELPILPDLPRL